ncbi:hypothetical protein ACFQ0I_15250 [Mariniflexile aquimaris]|uniref:Lipoprotein n=1 Tax=Mariniflexile aquimaris TaxID=881009 RepID=A0ABW3BX93_9FLAO
MKNIILYISIIFIFSCKQVNSESKEVSVHINEDGISVEKDSDNSIRYKVTKEDCVFDQETQTDQFLKGIKELENYVWDSDTKTAEIVLNDHWGLTIKRGGCNHFEMSASFIYDRILDLEKEEDKQIIFNQILWISSLLEDFDGNALKDVINKGKVSITKEDNFNFYVNFMDERLYELYFMNFNNEKVTTFAIGYYYD